MKDFKLEPVYDAAGKYLFHDLALVNGDFVWVTGKEAIAQAAMILLRTKKGENVFAPEAGIDYVSELLEPGQDSEIPKAALTRCLLMAPGVKGVEDLRFGYDAGTRALKISFTLNTDEGKIKFEDLL